MKKRLICINSYGCEELLTIGKIYEGVESYNNTSGYCFSITDDKGSENKNFYSWRFTPIEEWRAQQIEKILI